MEGVGLQAGAGHLLFSKRHILYSNVTGHTFMADKEGRSIEH